METQTQDLRFKVTAPHQLSYALAGKVYQLYVPLKVESLPKTWDLPSYTYSTLDDHTCIFPYGSYHSSCIYSSIVVVLVVPFVPDELLLLLELGETANKIEIAELYRLDSDKASSSIASTLVKNIIVLVYIILEKLLWRLWIPHHLISIVI